ncbi:MAG: hypothetical protein GXO90_06900, partial [FCB group bacterium]|nr:hypothetical protein [FCB group bacterium]
MSVNRFRLLIGLLAVVSFAASGQERLRLERADRLENIVRNGITVQILTGNVVFTKGPVVVVCDRAEYREKTGQGFMTGNVVVTKRSQNLTCDSLHYDSPQDLLNAYGRAHAWDEDYNLTADTLKFYTELDSGVAAGSVHFIQKKQDIRSDRIEYVKPEEETAARYLVSGNVVITEEDRTAYCGEAYYSPDPEFMELRLTPRLVDNDRTLEGEQIRLEYARDKLKNLFIPERAHVTTQTHGFRETTVDSDSVAVRESFTATDDLTGNRLNGFFVDGQLDSLRLEGMATTLYHIYDDSVYQGKNLSSGDTVIMTFGTGELKDIYIIGGSEGVYTPDAGQGDLEGPIKYSSESIRYNLPRKQTDLFRSGAIKYEDTNLKAGYILVDWTRNLLFAYPTVPGDSLAPALRPILLEAGREPMEGDTMVYNLKSRQGKVLQGWTKAQDGFYTGREIRNQGNDALFVENSVYTTCDLDEPHFHFGSSEMKLIQHDKVVARPLILYIAGIPVLGLPFAIFPNKGGQRHSGWIMPSYGESSTRGQFIDGLGYYWASSPYWDTRITLSFADRQGVTIKSRTPYRKRYRFSGNFYLETRQKLGSGEHDITQITKNRKTDYIVKWNHRQQMRHNQSFNVNASYYSNGEYNRNTGLDPLNRMNQQAIS